MVKDDAPVCLNCKQGDPAKHEQALEQIGCGTLYDAVDQCMLANKGNVSDCRQQWSEFRRCHEQQKLDRQRALAAAKVKRHQ